MSPRRFSRPSSLGALLFALASVSTLAQRAAPGSSAVSPAIQELRDIGGKNPLAILKTLPESPTFARIQTRTYDFKEAGRPMEYELYVPSKYKSAGPTPLIVALHCLGAVAHDMIRYEHLTELAEERGYIVVAPMG